MRWFWQKQKEPEAASAVRPPESSKEDKGSSDPEPQPKTQATSAAPPLPEAEVPDETAPSLPERAEQEITEAPKAARRDTAIEPAAEKPKLLARFAFGLKRSSLRLGDGVSAIFSKRKLDADTLEALQDLLISSDLGPALAQKLVADLAKGRFERNIEPQQVREALASLIADTLHPLQKPLDISGPKPQVVLFVGVNGSGKTTALGKIAARLKAQGQSVLMVAGDTFRAAAIEQLKVWGERTGAPVLARDIGTDAAGLAYDALAKAKKDGVDVVLMDTAGRLQNKKELMEELRKIVRVINKQDESAPHHVILVLDATVGQNALSQTQAFLQAAGVTGLIMTKLDGTARGGVLVAVSDAHHLPIHAIGIGERIEDLRDFDAQSFAAALAGLVE